MALVVVFPLVRAAVDQPGRVVASPLGRGAVFPLARGADFHTVLAEGFPLARAAVVLMARVADYRPDLAVAYHTVLAADALLPPALELTHGTVPTQTANSIRGQWLSI